MFSHFTTLCMKGLRCFQLLSFYFWYFKHAAAVAPEKAFGYYVSFLVINPVDTWRKLNVHKTSWTSSERLMYVQFTSCVYGEVSFVLYLVAIFSDVWIIRSYRLQMFFKIGALKNFAKFTGKHLLWSLFLIKLQVFSNTAVFLWNLLNF